MILYSIIIMLVMHFQYTTTLTLQYTRIPQYNIMHTRLCITLVRSSLFSNEHKMMAQ